ncbi:glycerol-3-phosphate dehydrogenase/oxidase [Leptospira sp. GIMC2001]|uniref:glycerol-3-phosphate dehydrogenase/oxidase n=1 Tax=Leptospira sp. GIMC2001 TaxID=1513297 RepID=UPI0023493A55|nr:glycerol-3-phosphate dehydrogenase/oxidase [Leptospira sp. GIMC2001]WCL50302.1 glycerol-3-phosphate dehydrogenase/oxidase [Leptospira sp. GIMC2001]
MKLRESNIEKLNSEVFDVLILGGGINGAVSAASLSAKGARVALIDMNDFASGTSQESSNLAWGGIKYLESLEFFLVRKLCMSRNHLMRSYPSTVQEIRFYTTIEKGFRFPSWFIYLGTWFYWFVGNCFTKSPRFLTKSRIAREEPVVKTTNAEGGFEYSDSYLHDNDARFVFNFIRMALNYGCIAANYVESLGSKKENDIWITSVKDKMSGKKFNIKSKLLINTCGPWADMENEKSDISTEHHHLFSKGIHLIVDRISPHKRVLTFFADDGRLFFVLPMGAKTCIGTTDTKVDTPTPEVTEEDREFVLSNINKRLNLDKPITKADIISERCGVRPLCVKGKSGSSKDWMQLSRKHEVEVIRDKKHLTVFGGKLTDCINVGEEVASYVKSMGIDFPFPNKRWYGEPDDAIRDEYFHQARLMDLDSYTVPDSSEPLTLRLWRRYGAQAIGMLENIREDPDQAEVLIHGTEYIRCELHQAARREMVEKLEDFLRRRSKISLIERKETIRSSPGLKEACEILFGNEAKSKLEEYFGEGKSSQSKAKSNKSMPISQKSNSKKKSPSKKSNKVAKKR